jgi:hypothetical protein
MSTPLLQPSVGEAPPITLEVLAQRVQTIEHILRDLTDVLARVVGSPDGRQLSLEEQHQQLAERLRAKGTAI